MRKGFRTFQCESVGYINRGMGFGTREGDHHPDLACSLPWGSNYCTYLKVMCFLPLPPIFTLFFLGREFFEGQALLEFDPWIPSRVALRNDTSEGEKEAAEFLNFCLSSKSWI